MQNPFTTTFKTYRNFIMGIAILWVALFHLPLRTGVEAIDFFLDSGYGGVDFFVFFSGFGLFYSLSKSDDGTGRLDVLGYLKRRGMRLLPTYIPFIIVWMILKKIFHRIYLTEVFGNLTMTGWWNDDPNQFNWYLDLLLLLYILAPVFYSLIAHAKRKVLTGGYVMAFTYMVGISFFHHVQTQAISRLPIFVLGMLLAALGEEVGASDHEDTEIKTLFLLKNWPYFLTIIPGIALLYYFKIQIVWDRWSYGLYWYPFILIVPGVSILLCKLADVQGKNKISGKINQFIEMLGDASLEIFLIHVGLFEFLQINGRTYSCGFWWGMFIIALAVGVMLRKIVKRAVEKTMVRR